MTLTVDVILGTDNI
jgi:hypothetical protein